MGGVAEGSKHLIVGELVGCLDVFDAVARTKGIEDRGHVDARPGKAGLAEPDVRTNRNAGKDLRFSVKAVCISMKIPFASPSQQDRVHRSLRATSCSAIP